MRIRLLNKMKIFLVSLERAEDRRQRMVRRLAGRDYTIVDAVDAVRHADEVDRIHDGHIGRESYPIMKAEVACFMSHLKALRTFVDTCADERALIIEDDVMFHKDFEAKLEALQPLPYCNVIMLTHYVTSWDDTKPYGPVVNGETVYRTIGAETYGTQAYIILREYALELLRMYEGKKLSEIRDPNCQRYTAEHITRFSGGLFMVKPIVIEEALDTYIQSPASIEWHQANFWRFGKENYVE